MFNIKAVTNQLFLIVIPLSSTDRDCPNTKIISNVKTRNMLD